VHRKEQGIAQFIQVIEGLQTKVKVLFIFVLVSGEVLHGTLSSVVVIYSDAIASIREHAALVVDGI
jgi:hypothetical protein